VLARFPRLVELVRTRLVAVGAVAYTVLTLMLTWQALRGQPLLRPDAMSLVALAALLAGTAVAVIAVVRRAPRPAVAR
jgi:putative N-acetylmannosamine-6-phosphate epimerase